MHRNAAASRQSVWRGMTCRCIKAFAFWSLAVRIGASNQRERYELQVHQHSKYLLSMNDLK